MTTDSSRPLGEWLRQRREELDISLEQAETDTRIRLSYLAALESETFDTLPDPVVGRGFLRNYATYLGLDPAEASDRYSDLVAPPEPESLSVEGPTPFNIESFQPVPLHEIQTSRSRWLWLGGLVLILAVVVALLLWWLSPFLNDWWAQQQAAALLRSATTTPRATEADLATATYTPTSTRAANTSRPTATEGTEEPAPTLELTLTPTLTPSPSPSPSPPIYTGIFLELVFTDTSWIQVSVDGVREFQGELEAETRRSWYGEERIELRIGNAGAVMVTVNGQLIGTLGAPGEVVDRVFEKVGDGVTEATVTPGPTGDLTAEPTETPTAEPTETPTAEPTVEPIAQPTESPTPEPTVEPTVQPTETPTLETSPTVEASPTGEVTPTTTP